MKLESLVSWLTFVGIAAVLAVTFSSSAVRAVVSALALMRFWRYASWPLARSTSELTASLIAPSAVVALDSSF
jgi:hypothetical protein